MYGLREPSKRCIPKILRTGDVGLARRRHADWTAVFSAAPLVPPTLLRELFRAAGVHIYTEAGDVVYANAGMLGLSAASTGEKVLRLRGPTTLTDVFDGQDDPASPRSELKLNLKRHETRIFWCEPVEGSPKLPNSNGENHA